MKSCIVLQCATKSHAAWRPPSSTRHSAACRATASSNRLKVGIHYHQIHNTHQDPSNSFQTSTYTLQPTTPSSVLPPTCARLLFTTIRPTDHCLPCGCVRDLCIVCIYLHRIHMRHPEPPATQGRHRVEGGRGPGARDRPPVEGKHTVNVFTLCCCEPSILIATNYCCASIGCQGGVLARDGAAH